MIFNGIPVFGYNISNNINYQAISPKISYSKIESQNKDSNKRLTKISLNSTVMSCESYSTLPMVIGGNNLTNSFFTLGDNVYIKNYDGKIATKYAVISKLRDLYDPMTKELLGSEYTLSAFGVIHAKNNEIATLELTNVIQAVMPLDRIIAIEEFNNAANYDSIVNYSQDDHVAKIIASYDNLVSTAQFNSVVINSGKNNNIRNGMVLNVIDERLILDNSQITNKVYFNSPDEIIGEVLVYAVYDKVSFGLITSSKKEIPLYATVKSRRYES